ncbi:MAG: ATP-dependent Clp protease adaptor ClpS [Muribaculaceae bacterium]|nr:ATP-dependent Clp protease adaptor ClpS [Muribaculaceae bacterium]
MPKESSNIRERSRTIIREPGKYDVVFHNDDFTPMDFVTSLLRHIFFKNDTEADILMLKVHSEGRAVVGTYTYDIAVSKTTDAMSMARQQGFPLRITVVKN